MSGQTCGDCRLLFFCRRAMGAASSQSSLRPLTSRAVVSQSSGADGVARRRTCILRCCLRCEVDLPEACMHTSKRRARHVPRCHRPSPGLAFGSPEDRLRRTIQYLEAVVMNREAAAYWLPRLRGERQVRVPRDRASSNRNDEEGQCARPHPISTASAAMTASAPSVMVFSSAGACTAKVSAKNLASAT
jgi:hypothetical protein